jgi:hypothetical protein
LHAHVSSHRTEGLTCIKREHATLFDRAAGFTAGPCGRGMIRASSCRIVDGVAKGQKYHLKVVFSDGSAYHSVHAGEPDV